ncbi:MAG: hypothetical protein NWE75_01935 [Candidatus Bathyarchaeota archaeon]|nr:hypothetical protein [Candidatus Bathyarchaeota archaeon]
MKFGYISYGKSTPAFQALTTEERKKEFEKIGKEAEKVGLKMLFWGHPFGVSENMVCVFKSEKGLDAFFEFLTTVDLPYTDSRTNMVAIP